MEYTQNDVTRFWQKVQKTDGCWLWLGWHNKLGYGRFNLSNRKKVYAHRMAYHLCKEPITDGVIMHICDNPRCCNPDHMQKGTHGDNVRDMIEKGRVSAGERHYNAKLSDEDANDIRYLYKQGMLQKVLAKHYNCPQSTISRIVNRKIWRFS